MKHNFKYILAVVLLTCIASGSVYAQTSWSGVPGYTEGTDYFIWYGHDQLSPTSNNLTATKMTDADKTYKIKSTTTDPIIATGVTKDKSTNKWKYIVVVFHGNNKKQTMQLFLHSEGIGNYSTGQGDENYAPKLDYSASEQFQYLAFNAGKYDKWTGKIGKLRIDPSGAKSRIVYIDAVALCSTKEVADAVGAARAAYRNGGNCAWNDLQKKFTDGGEVTLSDDVVAQNFEHFHDGKVAATDVALLVPASTTVSLDLAGHSINRNLTAAIDYGTVIQVKGNLTIGDSSDTNKDGTGAGTITGGFTTRYNSSDTYDGGGGLFIYTGGTVTLNSGSISGNKAGKNSTKTESPKGAGVFISKSATFAMTGGAVKDNENPDGNGGGIYLFEGASSTPTTFNFSGGVISGNTASNGGGIYVTTGPNVINMNGSGIITNNTAAGKYGGGGVILAGKNSSGHNQFYLTGGFIYGNAANQSGGDDAGGGIYCKDGAELVVSAAPGARVGIYGNTAYKAGADITSISNSKVTLPAVNKMCKADGTRMFGNYYKDESGKRYPGTKSLGESSYSESTANLYLIVSEYVPVLVIERTGLLTGESAVYRVYDNAATPNLLYTVTLTGKDSTGSKVSCRINLNNVGKYRVDETVWNWTYEKGGESSVEVTFEEATTVTASFTGAKKTGTIPDNTEKNQVNIFE